MIYYSYLEYLRITRPLPSFVARDIFGIPYIEIDDMDISEINNEKWLIKPNNMTPKDKFAKRKIVHSFCYDDELRRYFNNPIKFIRKSAPYYAISSFDFSMSPNMFFYDILQATHNNRWTGAFAQSLGKKVIPTVGWVGPEYYDITFAGLRNGGIFIISTLGVNNRESLPIFLPGYYELRRRFPDTKIICVGDKVSGMDSDVCYIKYEESFGSEDIRSGYWQPRLINWDMSIPKGVI